MNKEKENTTNSMITAFAVLIAIAAVFYAGLMHGKSGTVAVAPPAGGGGGEVAPSEPQVAPDLNILAIRDSDAPQGNGDIVLIEYSDYECPFCQQFHKTAQALVDSGEVTWIYRHLPLPFHATAKDGAVLGECVKTHRGSEAFWTYTNNVFAASTLNLETYKALAQDIGISEAQIDGCLATDSNEQRSVEQDIQDAQKMGVNGTPGSFLVNTKTKGVQSIPGALPVDQVRNMLKAIQ